MAQLDGNFVDSTDEDEEEEEENDDDDDEDLEENQEEEQEDTAVREEVRLFYPIVRARLMQFFVFLSQEPLNSEDDVTDDDPTDLFETDNVVVCQYDKVC